MKNKDLQVLAQVLEALEALTGLESSKVRDMPSSEVYDFRIDLGEDPKPKRNLRVFEVSGELNDILFLIDYDDSQKLELSEILIKMIRGYISKAGLSPLYGEFGVTEHVFETLLPELQDAVNAFCDLVEGEDVNLHIGDWKGHTLVYLKR